MVAWLRLLPKKMWSEVKTSFWLLVAILLILVAIVGPPLIVAYVVGPFNVAGFLFWSVIDLVVRAGLSKYR